jgi:hypothetical protein
MDELITEVVESLSTMYGVVATTELVEIKDDTIKSIMRFPDNFVVQLPYYIVHDTNTDEYVLFVINRYTKRPCEHRLSHNFVRKDNDIFKMRQCFMSGIKSSFLSINAQVEEIEHWYFIKDIQPTDVGNNTHIRCNIEGVEMEIIVDLANANRVTAKVSDDMHVSQTPINIILTRNVIKEVIKEILILVQEPDKIKFPDPYKLKHKMNLHHQRGTQQIVPYIGVNQLGILFYTYLFTKYKNKCVELKNKPKLYLNKTGDNLTDTKLLLQHASQLASCIANGSNILIIPLDIFLLDSSTVVGHANILIYRRQYNHFEHFEPHGTEFSDASQSQNINYLLTTFIDRVNTILHMRTGSPPITFIRSSDVCPSRKGFQSIEEASTLFRTADEPNGYCSAWSMFFAEMCLKNPTKTSNELIRYILISIPKDKSKNDYLRRLIRGYSQYINEKINKYLVKMMPDTEVETLYANIRQNIKTKETEDIIKRLQFIIKSPEVSVHYHALFDNDVSDESISPKGGKTKTRAYKTKKTNTKRRTTYRNRNFSE